MAEPPQHDRSQIDDTELAPTDSYQDQAAHDESEEMPEEAAFSTSFQPGPEPASAADPENLNPYLSETQETELKTPDEHQSNEGEEDAADGTHEASFSSEPQPTPDEFFAEESAEPTHIQEATAEQAVETETAPLNQGVQEKPQNVSDEEAFSTDHRDATDAYAKENPEEPEVYSDMNQGNGSETATPSISYKYDTNQSYQVEKADEEIEGDDEDEDGERAVSFRNKRVLLIEDEKETADIISKHLKRMGFGEVTVTSNATGALNQLAKDKDLFPDIVLLELALIGMDGIQFLAQLRASKNKRVQNLPAVVITMLDSPSIYRRAARQKVGAFLRKPVSTESLRKGMHDALAGQIVEKPFSQPKSWLDDIDEEELRAKRDSVKAKASAKAQKLGFWGRLLDALIPWSGKA